MLFPPAKATVGSKQSTDCQESQNETYLILHASSSLCPTKTRTQKLYFCVLLCKHSLGDTVLTVESQNLEGSYTHFSTSSILKMRTLGLSNQPKTSQPFPQSRKLGVEPRTSGLPGWTSPSVSDHLSTDGLCWKDLLPWPQGSGYMYLNMVNVRSGGAQSLSRHIMNTQSPTHFCLLIYNTSSSQVPRHTPKSPSNSKWGRTR